MRSIPAAAAGSQNRLSLSNINRAAEVIDPVFLNTPQYVSGALSEELGLHVLVKVETANPIRSFKGRGADYFASSLAAGSHIVTASAGNLGQALAYSCSRRGVRLTVYASTKANALKVRRMKAMGAEVILFGDDFDDAKVEARRVAAFLNVPMVEDGREPRLSEGAGTIAAELLQGRDQIEAVLVALGNGAILGGMARYIKAVSPNTEVIGAPVNTAIVHKINERRSIRSPIGARRTMPMTLPSCVSTGTSATVAAET